MALPPPKQPIDQLFEAAVNANMGRLIALARAMLGAPTRDSKSPEDLVQDALVKLFRQRHAYDWTDGGWSLMAKSVARNVISCRRRKLGQSLDADEVLSDSLGAEQDPAERMMNEESTAIMRARIEALPDSWREALVLREKQGLAYKEIAEALQASEAQVKTWLHRARARLLNWMAEDEEPRVSGMGAESEQESREAVTPRGKAKGASGTFSDEKGNGGEER